MKKKTKGIGKLLSREISKIKKEEAKTQKEYQSKIEKSKEKQKTYTQDIQSKLNTQKQLTEQRKKISSELTRGVKNENLPTKFIHLGIIQKIKYKQKIEKLGKEKIALKKREKIEKAKILGYKILSAGKKVESKAEIAGTKILGGIGKLAKRKVVVRKVLRPSRTTLKIKAYKPEPYVSRYFKNEVEEAKRSMFFE